MAALATRGSPGLPANPGATKHSRTHHRAQIAKRRPSSLTLDLSRRSVVGDRDAVPADEPVSFTIPDQVVRSNAELVEKLKGKLILAPLTKGGNLPFRRLCCDFGAEATVSEMAYARALLNGMQGRQKGASPAGEGGE